MSTTTSVPPADERQPLLAGAADEEISVDSQSEDIPEEKPFSRQRWLLSYGAPVILFLVAVGLFIKAFIDSGDVHVSLFVTT